MRRFVLGTRGSPLALWQARHVAARLSAARPEVEIEERIIRTEGDIQQERALGAGDRGVFVRRIEQALAAREIDLAVHSLKDLPTRQPDDLAIAAVPEREDPRDALLSREGWGFADCPPGTTLATGSPRRRCQLLYRRPELATQPVRGNVDTRIRRLLEGRYGAVVLALAGVRRLGIDTVAATPIEIDVCVPAVGQGALAIETRAGDEATLALVAALEHGPTRRAVTAERAFLQRLGGGCLAPAAAHAVEVDGKLWLRAAVGHPDGEALIEDREETPPDGAAAAGERLAERMLRAGAGEFLELARDDAAG